MSKDCFVQIVNGTRKTLTLGPSENTVTEGHFNGQPANTLLPGGATTFSMSKNVGFLGSGGVVHYAPADNVPNGESIDLSFGCPLSADNYARESVEKGSFKVHIGPFSTGGDLYVQFTIVESSA